MQPTRNTQHVCPITSPFMKKLTSSKSTLPSRWTQSSFSRVRDTSGGPCRPKQSGRLSLPLRQRGPQDHKCFAMTTGMTTDVQVQLRQLSSQLQQLETLSERFAPTYDWSRRYIHLRGMVDSVILAHQVRVLVSPVGEDLGRLS